jgi:5-methylcytosine-specific restriction enzyme A
LIGCEDNNPEIQGEVEGRVVEMTMKLRERSRRNRLLCLAVHGHICSVCKFDPVSVYGSDDGRILEVHHIEPLSESTKPRVYDPVNDLIPLCPNCHRAIHRRIPAYTPDELKSRLLNT